MKKDSFCKIVLVLAVLCVIPFLTNCQTLGSVTREPVVSLHSAEIVGVSFTDTELLCIVRVENPNPFDIPFPEIVWELYINENFFVSGLIRNDQRIRARNSTLVEIPVNLNYLDIINTFLSLRGRRQFDYKVALAANFSIPVLGERTVRLEHDGTIPLPQAPRLSSPSMRVDSVDLNGAQIHVSVNIENPNNFALPTPRISINYLVNGVSFINSTSEARAPIAASGTTPLVFGFSVRYMDLLRRFPNLVAQRQVSTALNLSVDFGVPVFAEPLGIQIPGTLPLR